MWVADAGEPDEQHVRGLLDEPQGREVLGRPGGFHEQRATRGAHQRLTAPDHVHTRMTLATVHLRGAFLAAVLWLLQQDRNPSEAGIPVPSGPRVNRQDQRRVKPRG